MFNGAGFFGKTRTLNWAECASTATLLDDLLEYRRGTPSSFFFFRNSKINKNLHPVGEFAVVTTGKKKSSFNPFNPEFLKRMYPFF